MTIVVGVDVGGTKLAACSVDPATGWIDRRERAPSRPESGGAAVLEDCIELVRRVRGDAPVTAIGIGLCELVTPEGRPSSAVTVDWRELDVAGAFADTAPTVIESDVRAAALAEARLGAGRNVTGPWLFVSIGTGISCVLVIGGRPLKGARGNALVFGAPPVELVAGGLALQQRGGRPRAEDVLADPRLAPLVAEAAASLGQTLAVLVNAVDPALIVIGGGLGLETSYREAAVRTMRELIEAEDTRTLPVVPAVLGADAGMVGAALAAADHIAAPAN